MTTTNNFKIFNTNLTNAVNAVTYDESGNQISSFLPLVLTLSVVCPDGGPDFTLSAQVLSAGSSNLTDMGVVYSSNNFFPVLSDTVNCAYVSYGNNGTIGVKAYSMNVEADGGGYFVNSYAVNSSGVSYGSPQYVQTGCLARGTRITLHDGSYKNIEDITYDDMLKVWNFDKGSFDAAKPLWIMKPKKSTNYNLIEFDDGSILKTIVDHRIYNKELGKFTYTMDKNDTPLLTTTIKENGEEVKLVTRKMVFEDIESYNIMTHTHMNMYANGILTSCRYNNVYPIDSTKMTYVKDENRQLRNLGDYNGVISQEVFDGLRLAEQTISPESTIKYVSRFNKN